MPEFHTVKRRRLSSQFDTSRREGKRNHPVKRRKLPSNDQPLENIEIYRSFFSPARIEIDEEFVDVMISTYNERTREVVVLCEISGGEIIPCRNLKSRWYYYSIYKRNYAYSKNAGRINLAIRE